MSITAASHEVGLVESYLSAALEGEPPPCSPALAL